MIAERPGGVRPTGEPGRTPDTKAQREEAQKVEKVREVDPDEEMQRRRRKFQMMMGDEDQLADANKGPRAPSPFEVEFHAGKGSKEVGAGSGPLGGSFYPGEASETDVDNAIVPSPSYSPPPDVNAAPPQEEEPDALPQSDDFWSDADMPTDMSTPRRSFSETESSLKRSGLSSKEGEKKPDKKKEDALSPFGPSAKIEGKKTAGPEKKDKMETPFLSVKGEEGPQTAKPSPKGKGTFPEAAPSSLTKGEKVAEKEGLATARYLSREEELKGASRSDEAIPSAEKTPSKKGKGESLPKKEEARKTPAQKKERDDEVALSYGAYGPTSEEREGGGGAKQKGAPAPLNIAPPSLPPLPAFIQPIAATAASQATSYLSPETIPLYFQMVGSIYVMIAPPGISRTEILLNNPAYSNSKFYGARITIEKYATAPDSFNIRLSGSDAAVTAFKENIPSLMTSFQNGNFTFRVHRLEAEFAVERPVFRRKEWGEKGKESGGDLGERRK